MACPRFGKDYDSRTRASSKDCSLIDWTMSPNFNMHLKEFVCGSECEINCISFWCGRRSEVLQREQVLMKQSAAAAAAAAIFIHKYLLSLFVEPPTCTPAERARNNVQQLQQQVSFISTRSPCRTSDLQQHSSWPERERWVRREDKLFRFITFSGIL